jgi:hypothetical protein
MFNCKLNLRRGLNFVVFIAAAVSANTAFAFGSIGDEVESICANAGNEMIVDTGSCFACHNDGDGGSGAGKTAASGDLATIIEYFCPDPVVIPPVPTCIDNDGDGYDLEGNCGLADCNDSDPLINPEAQEDCGDGIDNNCNGLIDTADPTAINCPIACTDMDGDGFSTEGGVCGAVDCDDNNAAVNPGAEESCTDGVDNNCNDMIDAADAACAVSPPVPPTEPPTGGDDGDHDGDDDDHDDDDDDDDDESDGDRDRDHRGDRRGDRRSRGDRD